MPCMEDAKNPKIARMSDAALLAYAKNVGALSAWAREVSKELARRGLA